VVWQKLISLALRPLRFGVVGLINTAVGLGLIFGAKAIFGLGDLLANAIGYGVGVIVSFTLNRRWTFRDQHSILPAFARFGLAFGVSYAVNLATVFGLRDLAHLDAYVAQAMGVIPYTVCFYLISAHYVFPGRRNQGAVSDASRNEING
jgi:putative flippase GtrA